MNCVYFGSHTKIKKNKSPFSNGQIFGLVLNLYMFCFVVVALSAASKIWSQAVAGVQIYWSKIYLYFLEPHWHTASTAHNSASWGLLWGSSSTWARHHASVHHYPQSGLSYFVKQKSHHKNEDNLHDIHYWTLSLWHLLQETQVQLRMRMHITKMLIRTIH